MATQNPIEQEGVYPLPEAQRDRFLMKIRVGGVPDADLHEEPVALGLGQRVHALLLDRVLGGHDQERARYVVEIGRASCRDRVDAVVVVRLTSGKTCGP